MTVFFHGTDPKNLASIQKAGLLRFPPSRVWPNLSRNCVYLASNIPMAWIWARGGPRRVVLKVDVPEGDQYLVPDRNVEFDPDEKPDCFECWTDIPVSHIWVGVGKTGRDMAVDFTDWIPLAEFDPVNMEGSE